VVTLEQAQLVDHVLARHRLRDRQLADDLCPLLLRRILELGERRTAFRLHCSTLHGRLGASAGERVVDSGLRGRGTP
jgi:hypothetical protein